MGFFLCNKSKIPNKPTKQQDPAVSKALLGKNLKSLIINIDKNSQNCCIPRRHRLLGQTTEQP